MKGFLLLISAALLGSATGKVPDYLQPFICKASDPEYEKCVLTNFESTRSYLMKGIPELSVPPLDPFIIPIMTVNRSLLDVVSINATCRNIRVEGGRNIVIEGIKANPIEHTGEFKLTLPWSYMEMEYEVTGHLLNLPLQSKGFFKGNFTTVQFHVKVVLDTYQKTGDDYFKVKKINSKIVVGNGWIKLVAKNPALQFGADMISNFFNENPRRVMDAVNPIFVDTSNELFRVMGDKILASLKAEEWVPA